MPQEPRLIVGMPHAEYHADPAPEPSLSASIAALLIGKSPRHAWARHPRLNEALQPPDPTDEMDDGSALHRLLLGAGAKLMLVPHDSWRSDDAKILRRRARAQHRIPILRHRLPQLDECVAAARQQLRRDPDAAGLFGDGSAEVVAIYQKGASWRRLRLDWMPQDPLAPVFDLKFTTESAATEAWSRKVWEENGLRSAFYLDGLEIARGGRPAEYRLVVIEMKPPYGVNIFAADHDVLAAGDDELREAERSWDSCLKSGRWPSYARGVKRISLPGWKAAQLEEARMLTHVRQVSRKATRAADKQRKLDVIHRFENETGGAAW